MGRMTKRTKPQQKNYASGSSLGVRMKERLDDICQTIAYNTLIDSGYLRGTAVGLREWLSDPRIVRNLRRWCNFYTLTDDIELLNGIVMEVATRKDFDDKIDTPSISWRKNTWVLANRFFVQRANFFLHQLAYSSRGGLIIDKEIEPSNSKYQLWFGRGEEPLFALKRGYHYRLHFEYNEDRTDRSAIVNKLGARMMFHGVCGDDLHTDLVDIALGERFYFRPFCIQQEEFDMQDSLLEMMQIMHKNGELTLVETGDGRGKTLLSELSV